MRLRFREWLCRQRDGRLGFSLIEVNMAVFVVAVGIIVMAALYPLGLRESMQSTADLKQSMFADVVLGAAVAAASNTNMTWATFSRAPLAQGNNMLDNTLVPPSEIGSAIDRAVAAFNSGSSVVMTKDKNYRLYCFRVPRSGGDTMTPIMGFLVFSLDVDTRSMSSQDLNRLLGNQQVYYAEALFQGVR